MGGYQRTNSFYLGGGPQVLEGAGSGSGQNIAYPVETFETPTLDFTQTHLNIELIPARPGHFPVINGSTTWVLLSFSGVQTTPPSIQAGSDAAHTNFFPSTQSPSNSTINPSTPPCAMSSGPPSPTTSQRFAGLPVFMDVTAPGQGTGGYGFVGRFYVTVTWIAVGGSQ